MASCDIVTSAARAVVGPTPRYSALLSNEILASISEAWTTTSSCMYITNLFELLETITVPRPAALDHRHDSHPHPFRSDTWEHMSIPKIGSGGCALPSLRMRSPLALSTTAVPDCRKFFVILAVSSIAKLLQQHSRRMPAFGNACSTSCCPPW